jgi:hypothetical protein
MRDQHFQNTPQPSRAEILRWASIKFGLLAEGASISQCADSAMHDVKRPIRTRSGISGGLDVWLEPLNIPVNIPVTETFAKRSPYVLEYENEQYFIRKNDERICTIMPMPSPAYYGLKTADGKQDMQRIGQMCSGDRFCYGMTGPSCYFWKQERRCQYCSIGENYSEDAAKKQEMHLMEVLALAVQDDRLPARHILIGGGTPPGEDRGALMAARLCEKIKKAHDISIYVMIAAPAKNQYIDDLKNAGADELGMNLELWSEEGWNFIPGKRDLIGRERYLEALQYSVEVFGRINTRSILIAGLEPAEATVEGAITLAKMGVMPIISPFRPLDGTILSEKRGLTGEAYTAMWDELDRALEPLNMPVGPSCIACQNNTLALPFGDRYRVY